MEKYVDPGNGNGTFTEFVFQMEKCSKNGTISKENSDCVCDIGVGGWTLSDNRLGKVDFVEPFLFDTFRVLTHANNTRSLVGDVFFFTAFETSVWVCVFLLILFFAILKLLDENFVPSANHAEAYLPENPSYWEKMKNKYFHGGIFSRTIYAFQSIGTFENTFTAMFKKVYNENYGFLIHFSCCKNDFYCL